MEAGNIVMLKSGTGPKMVVESVEKNGAHVIWYENGEMKTKFIMQAALMVVS